MEPTQNLTQESVHVPIPISIPPTKHNWIIIALSVFSVILLTLIISFSFQNQESGKQSVNQKISPTIQSLSPTPKTISLISIPPDETLNWKTYTNKKNGYSIKYPANWTYREYPDIQTGAGFRPLDKPKDTQEVISINIFDKGLGNLNTTFEDYLKKVCSQTHSGGGDTSLNTTNRIITQTNEIGYIITCNVSPIGYFGPTPGKEENPNPALSLPDTYFNTQNPQENLIQISLSMNIYLSIYKKMLSTFKFLDQISQNSCISDTDCGINYCGCEEKLKINIVEKNNICAQYCPGKPKCIDSKCIIVE